MFNSLNPFRIASSSAVMLAGIILLSACSQPPVPQDRYYRINAPDAVSSGLLLPGTVEIDRFGAEGLAAGRSIIFVADERTLQEYNYDFWHKPPGDMFRDAMIDFLRASGAAQNFVTPEMRASANYLLTGRIQALETVRGLNPKAIVALELAVTDGVTGSIKLVRSYRAEVPADGSSVKAAVAAANQGVADIFTRFLSDLRN